jgi:hypothetical protein
MLDIRVQSLLPGLNPYSWYRPGYVELEPATGLAQMMVTAVSSTKTGGDSSFHIVRLPTMRYINGLPVCD